jgi:RNA polymerase sigma-70 factor (ECF subfamily)
VIKPLAADRHPIGVSVLALHPGFSLTEAASARAIPVSDPVALAQAGNPGAFEALYRTHVGRVHALSLRLTGDTHAAAELTQDTFVRAWESLASFRGESAFGSWLFRLAVNQFLGDKRKAGRRERRVFAVSEPGELERPGEAGTAGAALDLEKAIASLPERARMVFVLHDVEGYQHGEIAVMTGVAEGTSKAQLFRARRLLREAMDR